MKKTAALFAALWTGVLCATTLAEGAPKIQFDQTVYDFGKTTQVTTVSGVFKFKNTGDAILKVEPPKPSCGCTIAELKPDTLKPGETGELPFTLHLGQAKAQLEKHIAVKSNDPLTPEVSLTIKVNYTPLYDLNPMTLSPNLAFGVNAATQFTTLARTDGKPLRIARFDASKPWITATLEPGAKTNESAARIRIVIQRNGSPRRFNEYVHVYSAEETNTPASSIYVYGQINGEVSLSAEALYWNIITSATNAAADLPESMVTRQMTIRLATGKTFELRNPQCTIKGMKIEVVLKEPGKVYELVARLDEVPASTVSGNISFETSVAEQPRIEVQAVVNVFKP